MAPEASLNQHRANLILELRVGILIAEHRRDCTTGHERSDHNSAEEVSHSCEWTDEGKREGGIHDVVPSCDDVGGLNQEQGRELIKVIPVGT